LAAMAILAQRFQGLNVYLGLCNEYIRGKVDIDEDEVSGRKLDFIFDR
jgi:hypothetical protein